MGDWKSKTLFPSLGFVPFEPQDGRFDLRPTHISNALENVKHESRLHPSDMVSSLLYLLTLVKGASYGFRGSMCGSAVYTSSTTVHRELVPSLVSSLGGKERPILSQCTEEKVDISEPYIFNVDAAHLGEPKLLL